MYIYIYIFVYIYVLYIYVIICIWIYLYMYLLFITFCIVLLYHTAHEYTYILGGNNGFHSCKSAPTTALAIPALRGLEVPATWKKSTTPAARFLLHRGDPNCYFRNILGMPAMDTLQNAPFVCFSSQSIIEVYQQLESKLITSETHSTKFAQEWIKQLFNHHVVVSNYLNGGMVQLRTIHPRLTIIYLGPESNSFAFGEHPNSWQMDVGPPENGIYSI